MCKFVSGNGKFPAVLARKVHGPSKDPVPYFHEKESVLFPEIPPEFILLFQCTLLVRIDAYISIYFS